MNQRQNRLKLSAFGLALSALGLAGCSTLGAPAADLGLAGAGGVAGYQLSDHRRGGAAAGAAAGYLASQVAQLAVHREMTDAEKRGYDRAMNQAVKQQYWIIQEQQKSRAILEETDARLVPVVIPETTINGVTQKAHVEFLPIQS